MFVAPAWADLRPVLAAVQARRLAPPRMRAAAWTATPRRAVRLIGRCPVCWASIDVA